VLAQRLGQHHATGNVSTVLVNTHPIRKCLAVSGSGALELGRKAHMFRQHCTDPMSLSNGFTRIDPASELVAVLVIFHKVRIEDVDERFDHVDSSVFLPHGPAPVAALLLVPVVVARAPVGRLHNNPTVQNKHSTVLYALFAAVCTVLYCVVTR